MRSFPIARRRMVASTVAAVAIAGLFTSAAHADHGSDLKKKREHAHRQVQAAAQDLDGASAALVRATHAFDVAQAKLTTARAHVSDVNARLTKAKAEDRALQAKLVDARAALSKATAEVAEGRDAVGDQLGTTKQALLSAYLNGDPSLAQLEAVIDGSSLDGLTTQQAYGAAVDQLQINSYQDLEAAQVVLKVQRAEAASAASQVAANEKEAAAKVAQVAALRKEAVQARDAVVKLVATRAVAKHRAAQVRAEDAAELAKAKRHEEAIQRQILAEIAKDKDRSVGNMHGLFEMPVHGTYVTSPYGWRTDPVTGQHSLHNGLDLHAPCGSNAYAVGPGKVVYEYSSSSWGNRLFLDLGRINGHSYVGIYNHLTSWKAHTGDVVDAGDVVAYTGTTGWSTGCHLHFTLEKDGVAVDPSSYIGLG